jgi:hypothetical protein
VATAAGGRIVRPPRQWVKPSEMTAIRGARRLGARRNHANINRLPAPGATPGFNTCIFRPLSRMSAVLQIQATQPEEHRLI